MSTTETKQALTKGAKQAEAVATLLRARNPLIWIVTKEEARVEGYLMEAAASAGYPALIWDCAQGVTKADGKNAGIGANDIDQTLDAIKLRAEDKSKDDRGCFIMRDLSPWLQGPAAAITVRKLRNLSRLLPGIVGKRAQAMIVISPEKKIPEELLGHATVIEWPLPDRAEIASILDATINNLPEKDKEGREVRANALPEGEKTRDAGIDAAIGLTGEEAAACFAASLVQPERTIDPIMIASEKRRIIAREGILEWYDPLKDGLDAVGGLDNLKEWLVARKDAYSSKARAYKLPVPKGTCLVGISGCGKSLTAKAIATNWGVPLLKFDLGALKSKFVGDSEGNLRKAFNIVETIGRCVVWFDEIEKALQGATSGSADGGVSADQLGAILTWMQERKGESFVIATANDIQAIAKNSPEFLRKGRFDELWFIDLPNPEEAQAVLKAALREHGRGDIRIDYAKVVKACPQFTGSEIAAIVPDAMFVAFADDAREITTTDLIAAAKKVTPLAKTAEEKIKSLREWARDGRARLATSAATEAADTEQSVRALDL